MNGGGAHEKLAVVFPALKALMELQALDTAADGLRRRLAELPGAELAIEKSLEAARTAVEAAKAALADNAQARRALEKDVAAVDTRLSRFDDHRAAVKTNQEYTALLHEIATAKSEKDAVEEKLLLLMEEADTLTAGQKAAERSLADESTHARDARSALEAERGQIEQELARLAVERAREASALDAALLAKYAQLLKQRRGLAVARMAGDICEACHVRLRPHVTQQIRRNDAIVQCDSCQRILYFIPAVAADS